MAKQQRHDASTSDEVAGPGATREETANQKLERPVPWHEFLKSAPSREISKRFSDEVKTLISTKYNEQRERAAFIYLLNSEGRLGPYDLDQIFNVLPAENHDRKKDIILVILSNGGSIETAYQISKLCKSFTDGKFKVAVPRHGKSAATLLALGADEIHMGTLGQLGPIDPQLGGLPALGVSQALRSLAALAQEFPGSSEMFARYLRMALSVEQIGYCERISVSAKQYASRLLKTKPFLYSRAEKIANDLVYEYKHHGFVIDLEEARSHLGKEWIYNDTVETRIAEEIYNLYDMVNLFLRIHQSKYLHWAGSEKNKLLVMDLPKER